MQAIVEIATELGSNFTANLPRSWPYLALWFALHALLQYILPAIFPSMWDFLGNTEKANGKVVVRNKLIAEGRSRTIAFIHGLITAVLAVYGLFFASDGARLFGNHYSSTELTTFLSLFSSTYFVWDIFVVTQDSRYVAIGETISYYVHAIACFCVMTASLRPFIHHMLLTVLIFEVSTPFVHIRRVMIATGNGSGPLYTIVQLLFAGLFFGSRIVFGYPACYKWAQQMLELVDAGAAHSVPIIYMYLTLCTVICLLNAYWFYLMLSGVIAPKKRKVKKGE